MRLQLESEYAFAGQEGGETNLDEEGEYALAAPLTRPSPPSPPVMTVAPRCWSRSGGLVRCWADIGRIEGSWGEGSSRAKMFFAD